MFFAVFSIDIKSQLEVRVLCKVQFPPYSILCSLSMISTCFSMISACFSIVFACYSIVASCFTIVSACYSIVAARFTKVSACYSVPDVPAVCVRGEQGAVPGLVLPATSRAPTPSGTLQHRHTRGHEARYDTRHASLVMFIPSGYSCFVQYLSSKV